MALTGKETINLVGLDNNGSPAGISENVTIKAMNQVHSAKAQVTAKTDTSAATLAAADMAGSNTLNVINMTGTLGAGAALTLPTVADIVAAYGDIAAGDTFLVRIINSSSGAYAWTVTTATGWTLTGTMTVAQNTFRDFLVSFTSATAAVLTSVGTGTNS